VISSNSIVRITASYPLNLSGANMNLQKLQLDLEHARTSLRDYLLDLAKNDPHAEKWPQQISGTMIAFPTQALEELENYFSDLAKKDHLVPPTLNKAYACTQTALCLIDLLSNNSPPQNTDPDDVKTLYQALYCPGQLLPLIADFLGEKKDNIVICDYDVTAIVAALNKACLLLYVTKHEENINLFVNEYSSLVKTLPSHAYLFNEAWLKNEFLKINVIVQKPYEYARYHPLQEEKPLTFWENLWLTHLLTPWKWRFALGRLHARIFGENIVLPNIHFGRSTFHNFLYLLSHWTHLCLVLHSVKLFYIQAIKNNLKACLSYIKGDLPFFNATELSFNMTVNILKFCFFPLILITPILVGLTSLPLLGLQWLLGKIPLRFIKTPSLVLLDMIESIKDLFLLIGGVLLLSPFIARSIVLHPILSALGGLVSTIVLLSTLLALSAIGLSPQVLAFILGMGGLNQIVSLAFSPLISLSGVIGVICFPLCLALLTVPRMILEVCHAVEAVFPRRREVLSPPLQPQNQAKLQSASDFSDDPLDNFNLFIRKKPLLLKFKSTMDLPQSLHLPPADKPTLRSSL
jgi:hypothetical protein